MGIFSMWNRSAGAEDLDQGVLKAQSTTGAVLLDVRTEAEYSEGHVPGSINLPLDQLESIHYSKDTPLFVYCRSGARSGRGVEYLKRAGYEKAENIGGIITYHGPMER